MAEKPVAICVLYCGVCGLPAEYCEFGPDFEKCKPWLRHHAPDAYPELLKDAGDGDADGVAEKLGSIGISADARDSSGAASASKTEEVQRLPGGKIKKKDKQEVIIEKIVRNNANVSRV